MPRFAPLVVGILALSIGWGIRGNFGHEYGAMLPGALASMGIALLLDRPDWWRRIPYFGMLGALGWSFGGSISYMQVIAYTHSGHSPSVLYGFVCVTVIGFLWAAFGGAGAALAAALDRDRLTQIVPLAFFVFAAWAAQELWLNPWLAARGYNTNWYDTDWLGVTVAILATLVYASIVYRVDSAVRLVLAMGLGWWLGFGLLVLTLGLRMTPPRGDNWAGCLGMLFGLLWWCRRERLPQVAAASLTCGFLGGAGYAAAVMLKLVEVTSGYETNWHSVLEQTQGAFHGLALAVALWRLARIEPTRDPDDREPRPWADLLAIFFTLAVITYLNLRKNPRTWVNDQHLPALLYGWSPTVWFNIGAAALALALLVLLFWHREVRPIPLVPATWRGKGQLLFVALLWWMVEGNFQRALPGFADQRLITEGVIHLNAVLVTFLLLTLRPVPVVQTSPAAVPAPRLGRIVLIGLAGALLAATLDWAIIRGIYGDRFAGHAGLHIRFGPRATIETGPR